MTKKTEMYDLLGIGIGPFNLGLAALLTKVPQINSIFLEQQSSFEWHPGLLIEGTTLQIPFMADLVTMADPTSPYSFLNYLKAQNRMYKFYFLEDFHIPRQEYDDYCRWVAEQMSNCKFGHKVVEIDWIIRTDTPYYLVHVMDAAGNNLEFKTRHLVLGVGTVPYIHPNFTPLISDTLIHSSQFLPHQEQCHQSESITIIGSGQSAAEIFQSLLQDQSRYNYRLDWLSRSTGFFPMEYSKLGLEHFSPDYIDYFHQLPEEKRYNRIAQQDLLHKGISMRTIADIYDLIYHRTVGGKNIPIQLLSQVEVQRIESLLTGGKQLYTLHGIQKEQEKPFYHETDMVILATGYQYAIPDFLAPMQGLICWDSQGRYEVERNYQLRLKLETNNHIFIQNGEIQTHGVGAPDLGLGAYRNAVIIKALTGKEIYPTHVNTIYQDFGIVKQGVQSDEQETPNKSVVAN